MNAEKRRENILKLLAESDSPLSGTDLAKCLAVSRQVIVQDIALLRAVNKNILSTNKGYLLFHEEEKMKGRKRSVKVRHTQQQILDELCTIVDLGGEVLDVMVNHRIYGKVSAPLNIRSRRDVEAFVENIRTGRSTPLLNVTSGYHFHHVAADQEEILDEIEAALREKGFLADFLSYEQEEVEK